MALHSSIFVDSRGVQLPECFIEIGCVTDCIRGRAFSEDCLHSEDFMGCTVKKAIVFMICNHKKNRIQTNSINLSKVQLPEICEFELS